MLAIASTLRLEFLATIREAGANRRALANNRLIRTPWSTFGDETNKIPAKRNSSIEPFLRGHPVAIVLIQRGPAQSAIRNEGVFHGLLYTRSFFLVTILLPRRKTLFTPSLKQSQSLSNFQYQISFHRRITLLAYTLTSISKHKLKNRSLTVQQANGDPKGQQARNHVASRNNEPTIPVHPHPTAILLLACHHHRISKKG